MKKILTLFCLITILFAGFNAHAQYHQYTVLRNFEYSTGSYPSGSLFSYGTYLYGMTVDGGTYHNGTIFKVKPNGTGYTVLLNFNGQNGAHPSGSLISDGTYLYGMTEVGGVRGKGVIFKIKPDGSGYSKMLDFPYTTDILGGPGSIYLACMPVGTLTTDGTYFYGVTEKGNGEDSEGAIFRIKTDSSNYDILANFSSTDRQYPNGVKPIGALFYDKDYLYGMTKEGGLSNDGVIFKIKTSCVFPECSPNIDLFDFNSGNGETPSGSLVSDGTYLYGMTTNGGARQEGNIFKIKPDGTGYTNLVDAYDDSNNLTNPIGSLIYDNGYLYGITLCPDYNETVGLIGNIFRIKTDASGLTIMHQFNEDNATGYNDEEGLYLNESGTYLNTIPSLISDGTYLYGTTNAGGAKNGNPDNGFDGGGVVFRLRENPLLLPLTRTIATMNIDSIGTDIALDDYLIASLTPSGDNPVAGSAMATVTIDPSVQIYNRQPYVQRHYTIEPAVDASAATATITLYYTQADFDAYNNYIHTNNLPWSLLPTGPDDDADIENISILQFHGTGTAPGNYTGAPVQITPNYFDITWDSDDGYWEIKFNVTGFSGFYLSTVSSALPLRLLSFTGVLQNGVTNLQWKTGDESNTDIFDIQRSTDGSVFSSIGKVAASGMGSHVYRYTDKQVPDASMLYYRLLETDKDGRTLYSDIVACKLAHHEEITLYPNPANDHITITGTRNYSSLKIFNLSGQPLKYYSINGESITVPVTTLAAGISIAELSNGTKTTQLRFLKK